MEAEDRVTTAMYNVPGIKQRYPVLSQREDDHHDTQTIILLENTISYLITKIDALEAELAEYKRGGRV